MVKYERRLLLSVIVGLLITSLHYRAAEAPLKPATAELAQGQQTPAGPTVPESCPSTTQSISLKFKPILRGLAGIAAIAAPAYVHDRSIIFAHEASHAAVAALSGSKIRSFYVSPRYFGAGYMQSTCPPNTFSHVLMTLAGPLGGITAYLAWLRAWNVFVRYSKTGNVKESFVQGLRDPLFTENASLYVTGGTLFGAGTHYADHLIPALGQVDSAFAWIAPNDGARIQQTLMYIAPLLAKAYPFMAYAGLAGLVGYGAYGLYTIYKAKKQASLPLW